MPRRGYRRRNWYEPFLFYRKYQRERASQAHQRALTTGKPVICLVHGLSSSQGALEPMAQYYRAQGFEVLNIPSPSGSDLLPPPGSAQSLKYLNASIPQGSIVIGHSYGGMHIRALQEHQGDDNMSLFFDKRYNPQETTVPKRDDAFFITIGAPFAEEVAPDKSDNIVVIEGNQDLLMDGKFRWIWQESSRQQRRSDAVYEGGHGSADNWMLWVNELQPFINGRLSGNTDHSQNNQYQSGGHGL